MKLHYSIVHTRADGFPVDLIPAAFQIAWAPAGHHFEWPRTHDRWGITNGGSVDSPSASVKVCLEVLDRMKFRGDVPGGIQESALVMIDADNGKHERPTSTIGRNFLFGVSHHIKNEIVYDAVVGMYNYTPSEGEVPAAFIPAYAGKPTQFFGDARSDLWRPRELEAEAMRVGVELRRAAIAGAERVVMVMNPRSGNGTVLRADYTGAMLAAAHNAKCCTDILVWHSRPVDDKGEDEKVLRFLEDLAELAGRGNA